MGDKTVLMDYSNIIHAFKKLGITLSMSNARLLLKRFDRDHDDFLCFSDIGEFFTPKNTALYEHLKKRAKDEELK